MEMGEKDVNMLELDDSFAESRSRTQTCATTEKCNDEILMVDSEEERLVPVDDYDESKNQELHPSSRPYQRIVPVRDSAAVIDDYDESKNRELYPCRRHCEMNVSAGDRVTVVDTFDESRNRSKLTELRQDTPPMVVSVNKCEGDVSSIDSNDESKSRTYRSTLTVMCGNAQQKSDIVTSDPHALVDANDESSD